MREGRWEDNVLEPMRRKGCEFWCDWLFILDTFIGSRCRFLTVEESFKESVLKIRLRREDVACFTVPMLYLRVKNVLYVFSVLSRSNTLLSISSSLSFCI